MRCGVGGADEAFGVPLPGVAVWWLVVFFFFFAFFVFFFCVYGLVGGIAEEIRPVGDLCCNLLPLLVI